MGIQRRQTVSPGLTKVAGSITVYLTFGALVSGCVATQKSGVLTRTTPPEIKSGTDLSNTQSTSKSAATQPAPTDAKSIQTPRASAVPGAGSSTSTSGIASTNSSTAVKPAAPSLQISQKDHDPCSEATKRNEAFKAALVTGIKGAAVGALAGALVGKLTNSNVKNSAQKGALVGLGVGVYKGYNSGIDSYRRQCELAKIAQNRKVQAGFVTLAKGSTTSGEIVVTPDQGHFDHQTDQLTDAGRAYFSDMARQYTATVQTESYEKTVRQVSDNQGTLSDLKNYKASEEERKKLADQWKNYRIVITGHTDDQGDALAAKDLSERRAHAVAKLFQDRGVPESSLMYQGVGSSFPLADNKNSADRQKNNRIEAVVLYDEKTLDDYTDSRVPQYGYFSEKDPAPVAAEDTASQPPAEPSKSVKATPSKKPEVPTAKAKPAASSPPGKTPTASVRSQARQAPSPFDYGGVPIAQYSPNLMARLGPIKPTESGFSIDTLTSLLGIRSAQATNANVIQSCNADDAQRYQPGPIKKLANGEVVVKSKAPISLSDAYLFNTVLAEYYAPAGDHFIYLKNITAKRNGELIGNPQLNLFTDYQKKSDDEKRKTLNADYTVDTNAYSVMGEKGLLIRQFFPHEKGLVCMDMVIPNDKTQQQLKESTLVYESENGLKVANLTMDRKK